MIWGVGTKARHIILLGNNRTTISMSFNCYCPYFRPRIEAVFLTLKAIPIQSQNTTETCNTLQKEIGSCQMNNCKSWIRITPRLE